MKKGTYAVGQNRQAANYRILFKGDPGRVKGINNSPNLVKLFPNSPFYDYAERDESTEKIDRSGLLRAIGYNKTKALTSNDIYNMFAKVIDGNKNGNNNVPHVLKGGNESPGDFTSNANYNWLYRDKPMSMNFENLNDKGEKGSPDAKSAPVGSNAPIDNNDLNDKPFWGHANLNVPSSNSLEVRPDNTDPQLKRGTGGFGTTYAISNRPFAAQEAIGTYFTKNYIEGDTGVDRMNKVAGKSINDPTGNTVSTDNTAEYKGDKPMAAASTSQN